MTSNKTVSYKITQTLLNSWLYLYQVDEEYYEKAYQDFLKVLNKEPIEDNEIFQRGREFETQCLSGEQSEVYDIIKGSAYQVSKSKKLVVDNLNIYLLGIADFIKNGVIYDTKRVNKYDLQKYSYSSQHIIYLDLFSDCYKFVYLVVDNSNTMYEEVYRRQDLQIDSKMLIHNFLEYLTTNNLLNVYLDKWKGNY